ncbi:MAG: thymidine kinase [Pirellulaceae bacterium]|jgi:thymidine kinase
MAKLYFYYSSMNAGKSTMLLQSSYNYQERGMETMILVPDLDRRFGEGIVGSRIGLKAKAHVFQPLDDLQGIVRKHLAQQPVDCVLVDEAQFLTRQQVRQLSDLCDFEGIPVLAYGLRTDFQGELFEGSRYLLAWADAMIEVKTICHCGRKATFVLRVDADGIAVRDGQQVEIGGNDRYVSVCRRHFKEGKPHGSRSDAS